MNFYRRLRLSLVASFAALAVSSPAFSQVLEPQNVDAVKLQKGTQFNLTVKRPSTTTLEFGGKASYSPNGWLEIGGTARLVNSKKTLTLPAAFTTTFGADYTGTSIPMYVYAGYSSSAGVQLCVSDVPNKITVGSQSSGNTGYLHCGTTLSASDAVRFLGTITANATGNTVSDSFTEADVYFGRRIFQFVGTATSATAASTLVFTVPGLTSAYSCVATAKSFGTGPNYIKTVSAGTNQISVVVDTAQSGGSTVVSYGCF
jgi:hypothetical protein